VAKTNTRSLLGVMSEFVCLLDVEREVSPEMDNPVPVRA